MITTSNNIMTKSAPIIPNMLFQCLKVYMIYIDGPKPGVNSNLQAVLVDDARSDPRLIPCSGPKIGAKQKKTSWFGGGSSIFWGILNEFWMTWGPHDLRNHTTYPIDSPRPFFQASLAPRPGTRWASCQRGSRPCPGRWRSRIDRPRCGEWVQKGRLRQKTSHLGFMVAISPGIYGGFTWFYCTSKITLNGCNGAQSPAIPILFGAAMGTQVSVPCCDCIPNWSWWLSIPLFEIWDDVKWTPNGCLMGWFVIDFTALMKMTSFVFINHPTIAWLGTRNTTKSFVHFVHLIITKSLA